MVVASATANNRINFLQKSRAVLLLRHRMLFGMVYLNLNLVDQFKRNPSKRIPAGTLCILWTVCIPSHQRKKKNFRFYISIITAFLQFFSKLRWVHIQFSKSFLALDCKDITDNACIFFCLFPILCKYAPWGACYLLFYFINLHRFSEEINYIWVWSH